MVAAPRSVVAHAAVTARGVLKVVVEGAAGGAAVWQDLLLRARDRAEEGEDDLDRSFASDCSDPPPAAARAVGVAGAQPQEEEEDKEEEKRARGPPNPVVEAVAKPALLRAGLWSAGSEAHLSGECSRCHFAHCAMGCLRARRCSLCHVPHTRPSEKAPARVDYCRRYAECLYDAAAGDIATFRAAASALSAQSELLRDICEGLVVDGPRHKMSL